jgi:hypothetical protein
MTEEEGGREEGREGERERERRNKAGGGGGRGGGGGGKGDQKFLKKNAHHGAIKVKLFDFVFVVPLCEHAHGIPYGRGFVFFKSLWFFFLFLCLNTHAVFPTAERVFLYTQSLCVCVCVCV